ncbi:MAG TPA: DUF917 domain-containing protein [Pseudonocardiaceae bacterium]|jgi:hypothetical protein|nr:DUF917 domain-containing protein [Pseudonocardiaceae bacterium]
MSTGYVGAATSITAEDVPALYEGAKFYSPAVGDATKEWLVRWTMDTLARNGPIVLVRPDAMAPQTRSVGLCVLGSATALGDLPPSGDEFALAVRELEHLTRQRFGAVFPIAAATVSALVPLIAASQLDVPLLDADGMGRIFALIHNTSLQLGGVSPTPLVLRGATGESISVTTQTGARADPLIRSNVDTLGGWAALAAYPSTAGQLRRAGLTGNVSRLINVGRLLLETSDPDVLVGRLAAVTGCRRIGRGRIVELEHLSRPSDVTIPAHPSSVVVDEVDGQGRQLRLELRSEIVAVFADGALVAAAPDVICLVDVLRGEMCTLDTLEPGALVDVLVMPADAVWYSPEGLSMAGPATHGIPLDHPRRR